MQHDKTCARCDEVLADVRVVCDHVWSVPLATLPLEPPDTTRWSTACIACVESVDAPSHEVCPSCERELVADALTVGPEDVEQGFAIADLVAAEVLWEEPRHPVPAALPGRWAKITLANVRPAAAERHLESLWARIERRHGDALVGVVDNEPEVVPLALGDEIRFRARHVSAVGWRRALVERAPDHVCDVCEPELRRARQELDAGDVRLLDDVRRYGFHLVSIGPDDEGAGFVFTVGLHHLHDHPELIMFGMDAETTGLVVGELGDAVCRGERFDGDRERHDVFEDAAARFVPVTGEASYREYLGYAVWFHRGVGFPVRQVLWSDRAGRYPGEPGFDPRFESWQPRLDEETEERE